MAKEKDIMAELVETNDSFKVEGNAFGKSFLLKAGKDALGSFIQFTAFHKYGVKNLFDRGEVRTAVGERKDSKK